MKMKKSTSRKLVCTMCGLKLVKKPNVYGKSYAVRHKDPVICNVCAQQLAEIDDRNQEILEMSNYDYTSKNPEKPKDISCRKVSLKNEDLNDIISKVKLVIKGQDEAIKTISSAIYRNYVIDNTELKSNLIILGDSGSGKTKIVKVLANIFDLPYVIEDATRFTEAGYVGASVESMLHDLFVASNYDLNLAQKGILIIDEGDKKAATNDGGRDVSGESVLFSLLKIIEGSKIPMENSYGDVEAYFDTSHLTIIFIGAFPRLAKIRDKRVKCNGSIGFGNGLQKNNVQISKEYTAEDFISAGFPKEFVGRFDVIVELNTLTISDYVDIIKSSTESTFNLYVNVLKKKGIDLIYTDDVIVKIAEEVEKLGIGARGIKRVVQQMFKNILFNILANKNKEFTKCIINTQTVTNSFDFKLE
ncbi:MAG: AAA family ATPase [Clostridia bacterium]